MEVYEKMELSIEDNRAIEYELVDGVWSTVVCSNFSTRMEALTKSNMNNINSNCGCCEQDNQLPAHFMSKYFKGALEEFCEKPFDELDPDDFEIIKSEEDDFITEITEFSKCICSHNINKQLLIKYIPNNVIIKIGSECIKKNMPKKIKEKLNNQIKSSRKDYKSKMKLTYQRLISNYSTYIFKFGKHYGERLKDIPPTYKQWILNKDDAEGELLKVQNILRSKSRLDGSQDLTFDEWFKINKNPNY